MNRILFSIIIAQFFCTSVWFAGNAVLAEMAVSKHLNPSFLVYLTSSVQFGFIAGTLIFAVFAIADQFSPSLVFLCSALVAAIFNGLVIFDWVDSNGILICRLLTGFFLAGIYPVGMKIASDYFEKGLGKSLGFLVGALVLGTAFPHLIKGYLNSYSWETVLLFTSVMSVIGGMLIFLFVKDGPFRKKLGKVRVTALVQLFQIQSLRQAAFGYFGHMWELYTFWAFVPTMLSLKLSSKSNHPLMAFYIIGVGSLACFISGMLSQHFGERKIATIAVLISGFCCLLFPLVFLYASEELFVSYLFCWGFFVVADSPMFSSLIASNAPTHIKGSLLTLVNSIGFLITIISIQLIGLLIQYINFEMVWLVLAVGPFFAFLQLYNRSNKLKL